jgi:hypothetical protein
MLGCCASCGLLWREKRGDGDQHVSELATHPLPNPAVQLYSHLHILLCRRSDAKGKPHACNDIALEDGSIGYMTIT